MQYHVSTVDDYLLAVDEARRPYFEALRKAVLDNLPKGFKEGIGYGMITYAVPHDIYPAGYHCDPKLPLPFLSLAAQKNFIALYHMGLYSSPALMEWFVAEYPKHSKAKLDMGKSCIRFKKPAEIPLELIAQLVQKVSVQDWISAYESMLKK